MVKEGYSKCRACGEECLISTNDKGYCKECYAEIFIGDISLSIKSILDSNDEHAERANFSFRCRSEGQRVGIGKTTS